MSKLVEEWRDIKGYEGLYQVSDWGRIKSLDRIVPRGEKGSLPVKGRIINGHTQKDKHIIVDFRTCGGKQHYLHKLVAEAFIPNPDPTKYTVVHHIDLNPENNYVENLMWMSSEEHYKLHAEINKKTFAKKVYQYTLDGDFVKEWESAIKAAKTLGINQGSLSNCCNGGYYCKKSNKWINVHWYKGFKWSYESLN